jgi:hypothetical protein
MLFRRWFPGLGGLALDVILVVFVALAIYHNPTGSALWVHERAHNIADIVHQISVLVGGL